MYGYRYIATGYTAKGRTTAILLICQRRMRAGRQAGRECHAQVLVYPLAVWHSASLYPWMRRGIDDFCFKTAVAAHPGPSRGQPARNERIICALNWLQIFCMQ